jgi:hypothetical protein
MFATEAFSNMGVAMKSDEGAAPFVMPKALEELDFPFVVPKSMIFELPKELEDLIKEFAKPLTRPNYKYVFPPHRQAVYSHTECYWGSYEDNGDGSGDPDENYEYGFEIFNMDMLADKVAGDSIRSDPGDPDYITHSHRTALRNMGNGWIYLKEMLYCKSMINDLD